MTSVSFQELDQLFGEMLPERTLLSTVTDFGAGGGSGAAGASASSAAAAGGAGGDTTIANFGGGDDDGAVMMSACTSTTNQGNAGLLSDLGLNSTNPYSTQTCTPAATATY